MRKVVLLRARSYVDLWLRDVIAQTVAPFVDLNARMSLIMFMVAVVYLGPKLSADAALSTALQSTQTVWLMLLSFPLFAALNALCAPFRVLRAERAAGRWFGDRFVLHEPRVAVSVLVNASHNDRATRFWLPGIPRAAFVWYELQCEIPGRVGAVLTAAYELAERSQQAAMKAKGWPAWSGSGGTRISNNGQLSLVTSVQPETVLSTVRVLIRGWSLGDDIAI